MLTRSSAWCCSRRTLAQGGMHTQTICTTMWQRQRNSQQRWLQSRGLAASATRTAAATVPSRISHPRRRSSAAAQAAAADTTDESGLSGTDSCSSSASSSDTDEPASGELQPSLSLPFSVDSEFELSQPLPQQLEPADPPAVQQQHQLLVTVILDETSSTPVSIRIPRLWLLAPPSAQ